MAWVGHTDWQAVWISPSRPGLETWLQLGIATGVLKTIGIAVTAGPRIERYQELAGTIEADEFLEEDKPEPDPVIPSLDDESVPAAAPVAKSFGMDARVFNREAAPAPVAVSAPEPSIPVTAAAPAGSPLPAPLRHLSADGVPSPRGRDKPMPLSRFAGGFSDDVFEDTTKKIATWWTEVSQAPSTYQPSDFGLDVEHLAREVEESLRVGQRVRL